MTPLLTINSLSISFNQGKTNAVSNLSLQINAGECLALVGESGSGKTLTALSIIQLLPPSATVASNSRVEWEGKNLLDLPQRDIRTIRGGKVGFIFQDALAAFNPVKTIGEQLLEARRLHHKEPKKHSLANIWQCCLDVGLNEPNLILSRYPHQLSGGMRQRAMIAMALINEPTLLIADEPTTALDVSLREQILQLIKRCQTQFGCAVLFITHDLPIVKRIADRVLVMEKGHVVETKTASEFFANPKHPYSKHLLNALLPIIPKTETLSDDCILHAKELSKLFKLPRSRQKLLACDNISFKLYRGKTLAIVGESGSGKSTLARMIAGLYDVSKGSIYYPNTATISTQLIFQDPYGSLNPRMRIGDMLLETLHCHQTLTTEQAIESAKKFLHDVALDEEFLWRYPHELSGGQRQRVAIARALTAQADILILDEPTSALDVTIQKQLLTLLKELQEKHHMAYLLITHDMGVVAAMADEVMVLKSGRCVEYGSNEAILTVPSHPYTQKLLEHALN